VSKAKKEIKVAQASGKRRTAIARSSVKDGSGRVRINSKPVEIYEPELIRQRIMEPLVLLGDERWGSIDIDISVRGGGFMGQADAVRTAIARGLIAYFEDEELEATYKGFDRSLIVNDTRRKEPKHPLGRGARKKRQKSYR